MKKQQFNNNLACWVEKPLIDVSKLMMKVPETGRGNIFIEISRRQGIVCVYVYEIQDLLNTEFNAKQFTNLLHYLNFSARY